jgi:hypothetical protein
VRRPAIALLLVLVALTSACSDDKAKREDGDITEAGPISVFDLRPGDCLFPDQEKTVGEIENINAVPCEEPHRQEVFATPEYPADDGEAYPGEAEIQTFADAACLEKFEEYTGEDYLNSNLFFTYLHPSVDSWNDDDRMIVCVIVTPGGVDATSIGSVRATTTTSLRDTEGADDGADDEEDDTTTSRPTTSTTES